VEKRRTHLLIGGILISMVLFLPGLLPAKNVPLKTSNHPGLIETQELLNLTHHPSIRIIDMRTSLLDYLKGHIPNAVYLHFENLQIPERGIPGQAPDRICLERLLGDNLSLSNSMWIILYSEKSNPNATFLAWTLDYLGHKRVGILNGGWEKWSSEKLPILQEYPSLSRKKFFGKVLRETLAEKKWMFDRLTAKNVVILDARPPEQYSGGEGEEVRRGHIPGAKNVFWETTLEGEEVRVSYVPFASWVGELAMSLLPAFLDIDPEDLTFVPRSSFDLNMQSLAEKKADVVPSSLNTPRVMEAQAQPSGVRLLEMPASDKEGWKRAATTPTMVIPSESVPGTIEQFMGQETFNTMYNHFVSADADEEMIYNLCKWLDLNLDTYKDVTINGMRMNKDLFREYLDTATLPVHPGTMRYLKELGLWTAADDEWNEAGIALQKKYIDAWNAATAEADEKGINVDAANQEWKDLWQSHIEDLPRFTARAPE